MVCVSDGVPELMSDREKIGCERERVPCGGGIDVVGGEEKAHQLM